MAEPDAPKRAYDLEYARANIDWAEANLPSFEQRLQAWLDTNLHTGIREIKENPDQNLAILFEKEPFPLAFSVECGSYINTIRSSLDILATALATRHGLGGNREIPVYFPIAENEKAFRSNGYKGHQFVNALPNVERALIESIKPYQGGNPPLWHLNRLDNMRKHQRLLTVEVRPWSIGVATIGNVRPNAGVRYFTPARAHISVNGETILGFISKGAYEHNITVIPIVTINEEIIEGARPLSAILRQFITAARDAVSKFDTP
jgi:hypothetical protein